jgi:prolyl-tRNA synthetase
VLGERGLDAGQIEYKGRRDRDSQNLPIADAIAFIRDRLQRVGALGGAGAAA